MSVNRILIYNELNVVIIFYSFKRSIKLEYVKDKKISNTLTYEYHLPVNAFYKEELNTDNIGFCGRRNCFANGVFSIAKCAKSN